MDNSNRSMSANTVSQLSDDEKASIALKVDFEIAKSHYRMLKLGAIANLIAGAFFVLIMYKHFNPTYVFAWYAVLSIANGLNVIWANLNNSTQITLKQLKTWRQGFLYIFAAISLTWGSIAILFISQDIHYQLSTIIFLLAALVCFSLSSITDFTVAAISIVCLLFPPVIYRFYVVSAQRVTASQDADLNLGASASLFVCGIFLLVACYIGSRIVRKFFRLSFENVLLSRKLENMNKSLEQRVKDRTLELENSLKLVTYQSTHDLLTDLPNQRMLLEKIPQSIRYANQYNTLFGIAIFSINEMEKINDGLGYQAGDFTTQTVAQRLQKKFPNRVSGQGLRHTIILSRKDVFIILLEPFVTSSEVEVAINKLFLVLADPVTLDDHKIKLTASIGVSLFPRDGGDIKSLLMNADVAMLRAKLKGGNSQVIYSPEKNDLDISLQLQMASKLHEAITNEEFLLQYQPLVDLKTGSITGLEALVRWQNPMLGFITPNEFIPLAEANGIIVPLGDWVLREACMQMKTWHDMGFSNLKMSVNLSAKQLYHKDTVKRMSDIILASQLDPKFVELELTESEAFQHDVVPVLKRFKDIGVCLSIDDFGTGYSNLTGLKLLSVDKLKIDKSFIDDIVTNEESQAIVTHIIELAKKMNIIVLAEGVETKEQLQFLINKGCDMIQGYYFSPPVYPDSLLKLLTNQAKLNK
jgi:diguanylate cyclase (GGDEF)-like protein